VSRSKKLPVYEQVPVLDIGAEGKSIARINGKVVFLTKALPGDVIDIKIIRRKKSYMVGIPLRFHEYSRNRVQPFCKHFELCGGCKWQDLPYQDQLKYKQKQVKDNLERIGKVDVPAIHDILPAPYTQYYRNKMEYTFSNFRWLTKQEIETSDEHLEYRGAGLHIPGRWDKVVDIEHCHLQKEPSNKIRLAVKDFAIRNAYDFFDLKTNQGCLRNLIIRTSSTNELMVIVVFGRNESEQINRVMNYLLVSFPEITALYYIINTKANDSFLDLQPILFQGKKFIHEKMEDLQFKIGPKSFYQTNSAQAHALYQIVRQYASLKPDDIVYDLYAGTGTISIFLAPHCQKVVGIDSVSEAIGDARQNAALNQLNNTFFLSGDMKYVLTDDLFDEQGYPQILITDPPRAGMHEQVVAQILKAGPRSIVYVSCNPATQARDIQLLSQKYRLAEVQPVDMFPHTYHVENVVLLDKI